ncbi:MAG TPA: hypothetical protein VFU88_08855 [Ktedonobacterales bacterium]|nr:hypothetical protein [Ktedonobacterales bacterium]
MRRPTGVTILAILAILYGIFSLLLALLGLLGSALLASGVGTVRYSAGTLAYATISDAVLGILFLAFGIGAFSLKRWAWTAGVVVLALDVVRQIVGVVIHGFSASNIVGFIITIVIALVLLWYLFRPNVRAAFALGSAA